MFPQHDSLDPYVELVGKVEMDCSVSIQRVVNFGADFGKVCTCLYVQLISGVFGHSVLHVREVYGLYDP